MIMFGSLWDRWSLSFKICTPLLHILFSFAQLWGARVFYMLYKKHQKIARDGAGRDEEAADSNGLSLQETKDTTYEQDPKKQAKSAGGPVVVKTRELDEE